MEFIVMPLQDKTAERMLTDAADFIAATQAKPDQRAWDQLLIYCPRHDTLAGKWIMEAQKHEMAAREIEAYSDPDERDDVEFTLHKEVAAILYQCAQDLQHPERPNVIPEEEIKF
jgi:16S rRNA G1207 methylase RsmC